MKRRSPGIKRLLVVVILVVFALVVATFITYRKVSERPDLLVSVLGEKANLTLGSIQHTATRDGVREWTLEAKAARLIEEKQQLWMEDISVVYFLKDGKEVYLTAEQGVLQTRSNDIDVAGNVVVISEPYELKTKRLSYRHAQRRVFSKTHVEIISTKSYLGADGVNFDIDSKVAEFTGNVEGIFNENLQL
ncbi:MAG: LPS export ABC transporter periplasmic protein LptC [Desulfobacteraceae bacterium]|nr:LPS export ABC transporter periplasmic protein LptC [Desulfobacteraceae bacterium]